MHERCGNIAVLRRHHGGRLALLARLTRRSEKPMPGAPRAYDGKAVADLAEVLT